MNLLKRLFLLIFVLYNGTVLGQIGLSSSWHTPYQSYFQTNNQSQINNRSFYKDSLNIRSQDLSTKFRYRNFIIPTTFIAYGVSANFINPLVELNLNTRQLVLDNVHRKYKFDDYLQYAPFLGIFAFDWMGLKAQHRFVDRVIITGSSTLIMAGLVTGAKYSLKIKRPDNSSLNSFPSGHTATAFVSAHILFKEYKETSPWIGIGGYIIASTVGVFRIINNRHWVSDVIGGAGFGILSAELGYLLLPAFHKLFKMNKESQKKDPVF